MVTLPTVGQVDLYYIVRAHTSFSYSKGHHNLFSLGSMHPRKMKEQKQGRAAADVLS